ncbi:MAG: SGNH/GDSL hydrolase family protein [Candidatus Dadabacteria bacterium]|nr:SGNH/GDSL hydrolase family protein [Candidatus Dadabacteria bacterium]
MRKFLITLIVVFVLLIGAEVSLRIFFGLGNPPLMLGDDEIGYLFKGNQDLKRFGNRIKYNSYHQRSEELADNPDYRILMIGDSVTNGGVLTDHKDIVTEVLEENLNLKYGVEGEVLNASAGSWGIENEYAYIKRFGTFDSEIVILQLNTGDFLQYKSTKEVVGSHAMPDKKPSSALTELFYRYILHRYILSNSSGSRDNNDMYKQFEKNLEALLGIIKQVKESNEQLIVVLTPLKNELDKKKSISVREMTKSLLDENEIIYIDLLDDGLELQKSHFRDSIHFNRDGNQYMAYVLLELIVNKGLLPCCNKK